MNLATWGMLESAVPVPVVLGDADSVFDFLVLFALEGDSSWTIVSSFDEGVVIRDLTDSFSLSAVCRGWALWLIEASFSIGWCLCRGMKIFVFREPGEREELEQLENGRNVVVIYVPLFAFIALEWNCSIPREGVLIFTSIQGVRAFMKQGELGRRVLVVGEKSEIMLKEMGVEQVECFCSAKELVENAVFVPGEHYFYLSGVECLEVIPNWFHCNSQLQFTHLSLYSKHPIRENAETKRIIEHYSPNWSVDWMVFCSPSGVKLLSEEALILGEVQRIAALGPTTASELHTICPNTLLCVGNGKLSCLLNAILTLNSKQTLPPAFKYSSAWCKPQCAF